MPGPEEGADSRPIDDTADDARAAFEEVSKAAAEAPQEPAAAAPAEQAPAQAEKPAEAPAEGKDDGRARDEHGRFAPKTEKDAPKVEPGKPPAQEQAKPADQPVDPAQQQQKPGPTDEEKAAPPPSWSIQAKAAWDKADPALKVAVAKREAEINSGLAELRDYKDLKPFRERAARSGQSLGQALHAYTGIEELLRRNAAQGFAHVADNLMQAGYTPPQLAQIFASLSHQFGGAAPSNFAPADQNGHGGQNGHQNPGAAHNEFLPIVQPIVQKLASLEGMLNQRVEMERASSARSVETVVDRFRTDPQYKFFANVEDQIAQLIESGIVQRTGDHAADLAKAYDLACRMHPEISETLFSQRSTQKTEQTRQAEQAIADKAKAASKSLNGSAAPGTVIQDKASGSDDLEADVRKAVRQHAA